jgi:transposase InsO family protein
VLCRATAWFADRGVAVSRVLTDNGACYRYRSRLWRDTLTTAGIVHKCTRAYRPQANGKVERFNRTLLDEWTLRQPYQRESGRRTHLAYWLHTFNHHRGHTALGGHLPASRIPNLSGQYI